jgi:hypothetical protein
LVSITCEFIGAALVEVLGIIGQFRFCELLYGVGALKVNSYVGVFEEVCGVPYFWVMVCECCPFLFLFLFFFVVLILVGVFCVVFVVLDPVGAFPGNYCFDRLLVLDL